MPTPEQRQRFRRALVRARQAGGLTQRDLAARIRLSPSAVAQWESGRTTPRPESLAKVEAALTLDGGELAQLLGYAALGRDNRRVDVLQALDADPRLNERQRDLLAAIYHEIVGNVTETPPTAT